MFAVGLFLICILTELTNGQPETSRYVYQGSNTPQPPAIAPLLFSQNRPSVAQSGPSSCPLVTSCQCKWSNGKQAASCEKRNLVNIPSNLPQDTQVLEMNGNDLNILASYVFQDKHLTNLQRLFLAECKITHITDKAFTQLTNLVELDLSRNYLKEVPIKAFEQLDHSLRKLNLAHNLIQTIEADTFSSLTQLTILDLSENQLYQLKPGALQGLGQLKELKLVDNRLTQLPVSILSDLSHNLVIDLFGNSWNCDCNLRQSIDWLLRNHVQIGVSPSCATPARHKDVRWTNVRPEDFLCPPTIISHQSEFVVGAGSNVSLECQAQGSPPLTFVWFQDEKNLSTTFSNITDPPKSTKLLSDRRYEIVEEPNQNVSTSYLYLFDLQLSDTSLFLCWVENSAQEYSTTNFSLIVNNSPPARLAGSLGSSDHFLGSFGVSASEAQLGVVSIVFVIVLVVTVLSLLIFKYKSRSSKNSQSDDLKQSKQSNIGPRMGAIGTIAGANANGKFASSGNLHHNSMLAESDNCDDSDDQSSTYSNSSCRKNNRPDYDGFIEHMRTGIINIDYHSMSPVGQFNNALKNQTNVDISAASQQLQQSRLINQRMLPGNNSPSQHQQPFLGANPQAMHHFPSASNTSSSVPPYYGSGNGSASMATTTSDLSPGSGSGNTNFANNNGPTTNCDLQIQFNELTAPHTNSTTSYTNDYQSSYGGGAHLDEIPNTTNSMPPMYYQTEGADGQVTNYHPAVYTGANGQLMIPAGGGVLHARHTDNGQGVLHDRLLAQRLLINQQQQQQQQQRLRLDQEFQIL